MKILYGVQGTGNGHIARARAMSQALQQFDVEVDFLFSGREKDKYFSMDTFGDFRVMKGLTFISEKGAINYLKTAQKNSLRQLFYDVKGLDLSEYDLVLNDFEPISAWAAKRQQVPCISISHQNAFRYQIPQQDGSAFDRLIMRYFAPSQYHIGLHWYHFDQPLLPPIVHKIDAVSHPDPSILVYLPFESIDDICDLLLELHPHYFVCYHPEIMSCHKVDNIEWRPLCHQNFQAHLHACHGVIANGGFELPSEAISLGKKLLLKPLLGQFEQQTNVATLEGLNLATSMANLSVEVVAKWLKESPIERIQYPDVAQAIAQWIIAGEWECQKQLATGLWQQVNFPQEVLTAIY